MSLFLEAAGRCEPEADRLARERIAQEAAAESEEAAARLRSNLSGTERVRRASTSIRLDAIRLCAKREENVRCIEARRAAKVQQLRAHAELVEGRRVSDNLAVRDGVRRATEEAAAREAAAAEERRLALLRRSRLEVLTSRHDGMVAEGVGREEGLRESIGRNPTDSFSYVDRIRISRERHKRMAGVIGTTGSMVDVYPDLEVEPAVKQPRGRGCGAAERVAALKADGYARRHLDALAEERRRRTEDREAALVGLQAEETTDQDAVEARARAAEAARAKAVQETSRRVLETTRAARQEQERRVLQRVRNTLHPIDILQREISAELVQSRYAAKCDSLYQELTYSANLDTYLSLEKEAQKDAFRIAHHLPSTEGLTSC